MLLSKYICGMGLFLWEVIVNLQSNMNISIYYTFTGQFDLAKDVLDKQWLLLYVPTYLFAIWDSYRSAVDFNNQFVLARQENAPVKPFEMSALGLNHLDKEVPWVGAIWGLLSPGAGQFVTRHILTAFFLMTWWIIVVFYSRLLPAIHHTMLGQFSQAALVADKQWILNVPSLLSFSMYEAYVSVVENNKLFEWEQIRFLQKEYQPPRFQMPLSNSIQQEHDMYIISSFEHSIELETAVSTLKSNGIPKEDILAVPLQKQEDDLMVVDGLHASDGRSMLDFPIILAAVFSLFGLIYGFLLYLGPILWALIGTGVGFGLGLLVKLLIRRKRRVVLRARPREVVLMVNLRNVPAETVKTILWRHGALGISTLNK